VRSRSLDGSTHLSRAVEALKHQDIPAAHGLKLCLTSAQSTAVSQSERGILDALQIKAIRALREFCEPQIVIVLHGGLGSRAPHACAGFKLLEKVFGNALTVFDCLRRSDEQADCQ
jgi:hypothetical protein